MEATLQKFGYPGTLIKEYQHWMLLLRPQQVTLGSLILIEKSGQTRFSDLSDKSFEEYPKVIRVLEKTLLSLFQYDRINYLMLMMVDPEVHFHVIPRYQESREFAGIEFKDSGWPKLPELSAYQVLDDDVQRLLTDKIHEALSEHAF